MNNRVGDNVPAADALSQLLATLLALIGALRAFCITLSTDERKGLLHARVGSEPHIARLREIAEEHGVHLPNIPLAGMLNDLALFTALRPFQDALRVALQLVNDTAGQAESEAWEAFLAYYGTLTGMAKSQPVIAVQMKPIVEFMALGPRKKGEEPAKPAPAATTNGATTHVTTTTTTTATPPAPPAAPAAANGAGG
jgi:hypothetical protein